MIRYLPTKLPPAFHGEECDICGNNKNLKVIAQLLSDPPQPYEWRCEDCCKSVKDAREQKKYLQKFNNF